MSPFRPAKDKDRKAWPLAVACVLSLALPGTASLQAQELPLSRDQEAVPGWSRGPSSIQEQPVQEIEALIREIRVRDLSPEEMDDVYLIALAKPDVTLPILERVLAEGLRNRSLTDRQIAQLRDFIAYAGNEEALKVLSRLRSGFAEPLLNGGVVSLLSYAESRQNPFFLAYSPDALGDGAIDEVLTWARQKVTHPEGIRDWAEALLARQGGDAGIALDEDPLARQLQDPGVLTALHTEVERQKRRSPS